MTSINAGFSSLYGDDVKPPPRFEGGRSETDASYDYYTRHAPRRPNANSLMPMQRRQQQASQSVKQEEPLLSTRKGEAVQPYTGQIYGSSTLSNQMVEENMSESVYERQMSAHNKSHFQKPPAHFVSNHASEFAAPTVKQAKSVLDDNYSQCTCCKCNGTDCMVRDALTQEVSCRECNASALRV
jgi:hypothetical protein